MSMITLVRILKLGWANYWRNRGLSISATLVLTLTLIIVLIFFLLNSILAATSREVRSKIDLVVTFDDEVPQERIDDLQKLLAAKSETKAVQFISKADALERFQDLPGVSDRTKNLLSPDNNPLPRSLEIKATSPDRLEAISRLLSASPWQEIVRKNSYLTNKETIQKIDRFERAVSTAGLVLSLIFIVISLIVVINTIRLAIFARREEIEIMRLVGANNVFIRSPFIVEGIMYGLVATGLAITIVWLSINQLGELINRYLAEIDVDVVRLFSDQLPLLIIVELVLGLGVTIFASLISLQRYLRK